MVRFHIADEIEDSRSLSGVGTHSAPSHHAPSSSGRKTSEVATSTSSSTLASDEKSDEEPMKQFTVQKAPIPKPNDHTVTSLSEVIGDQQQITLEKPPNIDHYRMTIQKMSRALGRRLRPSMPELMHGSASRVAPKEDGQKPIPSVDSCAVIEDGEQKFGKAKQQLPEGKDFFQGVFIPVYTNIVGSLLYLRMGYVAGQAGIAWGVGVVLFSTFVIVVAATSLSAICSNGQSGAGGLYYVVSRAVGPHFAGAIALIFSLANVGMAALYIVGISEVASDLLVENGYSYFTYAKIDDIRCIGIVLCVTLMLIAFAGPDIENSFTLFMFSLYILSYIDWLLGTLLPVTNDQFLRGVTGYNWATVSENMWPDYRNGESVYSVFAVFFPGFTGMMAGSMFVGELRDAARDIPLGVFTSVATTCIFYTIGVIVSGATMLRDVSGISYPEFDNATQTWKEFACAKNQTCKYGLVNFYQVAELEGAWGPLVIAGIFGMTISSTMTNLDQGPINFQAACKDSLFGHFKYFGKDNGPNNLPRRAYIFMSFLTMVLVLIGDLNIINDIVSNLFLATYALVNYACFDASFARSPGWRPQFPYYNMWLSLFGAALCVAIMFVLSVWKSLLCLGLFAATMMYMQRRGLEVNWGDTSQAHNYRNALLGLTKITNHPDHVKNYRPQILLMTGNPASRPALLDFANSITKGDSLLIAAHVVAYPQCERIFSLIRNLEAQMTDWMKAMRVRGFYQPLANEDLRRGMQNLLQISGLGKLRPNILFAGWKQDWASRGRDGIEDVDNYVGILRQGVTELTKKKGDKTEVQSSSVPQISVQIPCPNANARKSDETRKATRFFSDKHFFGHVFGHKSGDKKEKESKDVKRSMHLLEPYQNGAGPSNEGRLSLSLQMNRFHRRVKHSRIDVWWLYDDGGLTLLIPHLLRLPKSYLEGAKLRVFTLASSQACTQADEREMVALLKKFRIEFSDVKVIQDISRRPHPTTTREFERLINNMRTTSEDRRTGLISELDLNAQCLRTNRQLRTRELLQQHSHDSDLIVITLPVPRAEITSSALYMAWLDLMTRDLPPVLMVRGNQTSVLTFYF
ncbi:hypothetical protein QR680_010060 [Steinernema hermaphroditum]|uniref:Solute carrier family 12 member 9 n=1 Tax=Steinernema hermaphroditum TaxID=289476 RepID=A0AA39IPH0_9BILA|nr:hypothetical protein QR680_010060 [Steinernema hermaphroditum]